MNLSFNFEDIYQWAQWQAVKQEEEREKKSTLLWEQKKCLTGVCFQENRASSRQEIHIAFREADLETQKEGQKRLIAKPRRAKCLKCLKNGGGIK